MMQTTLAVKNGKAVLEPHSVSSFQSTVLIILHFLHQSATRL